MLQSTTLTETIDDLPSTLHTTQCILSDDGVWER